MKNTINYIELVQQAQLGDKECRNRLAEAVRERLYSYVYRHTLTVYSRGTRPTMVAECTITEVIIVANR